MNETERRELLNTKEELARIKREYLRTLTQLDEMLNAISRQNGKLQKRVKTQRYGKKK